MKSRAVIPLVIGLAIGVFAIKYFINVVKKAKGAGTDVVRVVCAASDIAPTVEIKPTMLDIKVLPKAVAPKLFFTDKKDVEGRVANANIVAGLAIAPNLLAPKGTLPGLTVRIKEGMRAMSVQVDEAAGVAGWIKSGCHVDVITVMSGRGGGDNETISKVILQNVEVLAVGQDSGNKSDLAASVVKSVTLAVLPADMPRLHLAATKGKIRLAMRNQTDETTQRKIANTTDNELFGAADASQQSGFLSNFLSKVAKTNPKTTDKEARTLRPAESESGDVAARPVPRVRRVEVIQGTRISNVVFQGEGRNLKRLAPGEQPESQAPVAVDPLAGPETAASPLLGHQDQASAGG